MEDKTSLYLTLQIFGNDGEIDIDELNFLIKMALRDGEIDAREKEILRSVFDKLSGQDLSEDLLKQISDIRSKHQL